MKKLDKDTTIGLVLTLGSAAFGVANALWGKKSEDKVMEKKFEEFLKQKSEK